MSVMSDLHGRRETVDAFAATTMVAITLVWGLNQVMIKIANGGYDPMFLMVVRSALAAACVWGWCRLRGIELLNGDGTLPAGMLVGVLFGAEFILIFFGLDHTTASRGVLMINTMPFWVLIGAHFLLGERMTPSAVCGLLLAFGGVVLVFSDSLGASSPSVIVGDVMMLGAAMLWAATSLVIKRTKLAQASAEKTLLYQLVVSGLVAVPLLAVAPSWLRQPTWLSTSMLLIQAVVVVSFTFLVWFWLLRRYPATGLSSFAFLSPVFGVVAGGLLLGEPLTLRMFIALGLIAIGLVVVNRPRRTRLEEVPHA